MTRLRQSSVSSAADIMVEPMRSQNITVIHNANHSRDF
jgi:hypothetical protein